ncbi:alpha/beta-hydrolase [Hymenopellis radicata]|nr:alpha/beta-hydrolase [Hymenopellis radicata]
MLKKLSPLALLAQGAPTANILNGTVNGLHLDELEQDVFPRYTIRQAASGQPEVAESSGLGYGVGPFAVGTAAVEYQSEDCLTLNIVRPDSDHSDLPVLVWLYGGGYIAGTSSSPVYNLSYIVQEFVQIDEPIIAVSLNYRLAAFGFLASEEIVQSGNANLGLKDQRLALRWIQENIASFGGDPNKVTIWGESAGSVSVIAQVLAYGGKDGETGLFRGAIQESGTMVGYDFEHLQASYDDIVNQTGCASSVDTLDCLRSVPYDVLRLCLSIIDDDFLPDSPTKLFESGRYDKSVTGLLGVNTDEGTVTVIGWNGIDTDEQFFALLTNPTANGLLHISADSATKVLELYPNDPSLGCPYGTGDGGVNFTKHGLQYKRSASLAGDIVMHAPRRHQCEVMTNWSQTAYSYRFNTRPERIPFALTGDILIAVTHYDEIPFVFGNPANLTDIYEVYLGTDPAVLTVSKSIMGAWISFARHLNPNHVPSDLPYWPSYAESASNMVFDAKGSFVEPDDYRKDGIAFINARQEEFLPGPYIRKTEALFGGKSLSLFLFYLDTQRQRASSQYSVMNTSLPPEFVDMIIQHLSGHKDALRSCALVSRTWSGFSQRALFRDAQVNLDTYKRMTKLLDDLISIPHLQTLVRGLAIYYQGHLVDDDIPVPAYMSCLASVLSLLPNLMEVVLFGDDDGAIAAIRSYLDLIPNVAPLVELGIDIYSAEAFQYNAFASGLEEEFHNCLTHHFDLPNLKQCEIVAEFTDELVHWQDLLPRGFPPLELFKLELWGDFLDDFITDPRIFEDVYRPLPLAGLPFQHVHLSVTCPGDVDDSCTIIEWWSSTFRALSDSKATIHFTELTFADLPDIDTLGSEWRSLDDSLAHPMFSAIRNVHFESSKTGLITEAAYPDLADQIRLALPQLASRGVLCLV